MYTSRSKSGCKDELPNIEKSIVEKSGGVPKVIEWLEGHPLFCGWGFYVTTIQEQAEKMAKGVSRIYGGSPCITVYDFDKTAFEDGRFNIRRFDKPTIDMLVKEMKFDKWSYIFESCGQYSCTTFAFSKKY